MANANQLAEVKNDNELAVSAIPEHLKAYVGQNLGNEHVEASDLTIPRLEVVQMLSACRDKDNPGYIPGAEEGLLYNTLTRELYGKSVIIVPVAFRKEYLLWQDISKGGGFGGAYPTLQDAESARNMMEDPLLWEAVKTHQHICFRFDEETGAVEEIAVSMARSKMKVSTRFNSLIRVVSGNLPRFSTAYKVAGQKVANKQGQSYYNFSVDFHAWTPEPVFNKALKLFELFKDNKVTVDFTDAEDTPAGDAKYSGPAGDDDEI